MATEINRQRLVVGFQDIDKTWLPVVGGKGASLGELGRIEGIAVPAGFCVTTEAYRRVAAQAPEMDELLEQLSGLKADERERLSDLSAQLRAALERLPIPDEVTDAVGAALASFDEGDAFAVRSSATAEDLPTASFAGQQDTFLNLIGPAAILKHISRCWASLFTDRAVAYRLQNGYDHRAVRLAVVVQKMVFPQASGILFTADPVTSNRHVLSIDAGFGLGEALVAGRVNPDVYKVRAGQILDRKIAVKQLAVLARPEGGTREQELEPEQQNRPVLTEEQILQLERIGRTIEQHFGSPQDIEWCLADGAFYIVQSRPITTLFPVPEADDTENHVYVSVGHQQMMTEAMKPLGLSVWQLTSGRPMFKAGGRLFVDVAAQLASPARDVLINVLGKSDPLIRDALTTILDRGDFIKSTPEDNRSTASGQGTGSPPPVDYQTLADFDPAVVTDLIRRNEASVKALKRDIQTKTGPDLFDFILEDIREQRKTLADPQSFGVIMTAMNAAFWLNEKMREWLGEKSAADTLTQSVPNNVTSEMGLALLEVAETIRPYPDVIDFLQRVKADNFLEELPRLPGGAQAREAIGHFLETYGMRCAGEIDITRSRWREKPATLIPLILSNVRNAEPGAGKRKFELGRQEAQQKERELLERLQPLPDGDEKVRATRRMISLVRSLSGYREYPKYGIVSRYFLYKQALLKEAEKLVEASVIPDKEDVFYLSFDEFAEAVRTQKLDYPLIEQRKDEYRSYEKLRPPRVMTSEGEVITGKYRRENRPAGALVGLAVSSGVVEGRARVILNLEEAELEEGDILVTAFTDPSWTPLFLAIKGLVTEVGGLMTHGAVIAREYGLPAVVGLDHATRLIRDGQRIRVNGTDGFVELV